jgi:anti-anti-sigma factor
MLSGDLDYHSLDSVRDVFTQSILPGRIHIVDLSSLRFLDSSGLGFLLAVARRLAQEEGRLILMSPPPQIEKLLRTTGVHRLLKVAYSEAEALQP